MFIKIRRKIGFKGTRQEAQIATLLVLFVAVVTLLAAAAINISKVSHKRAIVVNATTGSVLQLASSLGSYARMLSCRYLECGTKRCKKDYMNIIMIVVLVVLIILLIIVTLGGAAPAIGGLLGIAPEAVIAVTAVTAAAAAVSLSLKLAVYDVKMLQAMNRAFRNMDPKVSIAENAIRHAFMGTVDDQSRVADMHDVDMDGKYGLDENGEPRDLINRFAYNYTRRAMWLADNGPDPMGENLNYKKKIESMVSDFFPSLNEFDGKSRAFLEYIKIRPLGRRHTGPGPEGDGGDAGDEGEAPAVGGGLPTEGPPPLDATAPDFESPQAINSLYALFAYLQEREYPQTKNELYNISYHAAGSGSAANIWTRGFVECPGEETTEEDPSFACYHSPENDELDALSYALTDFTNFSQALLSSSHDDLIRSFSVWWLYDLYEGCADEELPEPGEPCMNPDYSDYYDQIWQVPDDRNTEYVVEKGWNQAIDGWLDRLGLIEADINSRIDALGNCSSGTVIGRNACLIELSRLQELLDKVTQAEGKMRDFQKAIVPFRQAIERLQQAHEELTTTEEGKEMAEVMALYDKRSPTYIWHDSLGKHSVRVTVSPFAMPRLKAYRRGCCRFCEKLKNPSGNVWVRVTRRDEPSEAKTSTGELLWKFQYPDISYTAAASYDYTANPAILKSVRRNK